jgi:23S rRNA (adenine1618-N6)-methyltransferase
MTNPPFYASAAELLSSAALKSRPPSTACTGSASEMVTPGGETAFVSRLIAESLRLRSRVQWYSSMLGKLSSVALLVAQLKEFRVDNYAVAEFVQGAKTRRWALAWSFVADRPSMAAARGAHGAGIPKGLLQFPCEFVIVVSVRLLSQPRCPSPFQTRRESSHLAKTLTLSFLLPTASHPRQRYQYHRFASPHGSHHQRDALRPPPTLAVEARAQHWRRLCR